MNKEDDKSKMARDSVVDKRVKKGEGFEPWPVRRQ
jgi:hypothetical protein